MFLGLRQELLLSKGGSICLKQAKTHSAPGAAWHERELQKKGEGRGHKLNNKKNAVILLTQPSPPAQHCQCTLEATVIHCTSLTEEAVLGTCFILASVTTTPQNPGNLMQCPSPALSAGNTQLPTVCVAVQGVQTWYLRAAFQSKQ